MSSVQTVIEPKSKDLGGFSVRRILPVAARRHIGPFVFWDHIGPAEFRPGQGIDVRPHPHIGLATVTYLFDGEITHRDSLGFHQPIRPGDVNWMTAGSGIVHSERTGDETRAAGHKLHGIQSWLALPKADEETDPAFHHHPADSLPAFRRGGVALRLIAGTAFGETSPVSAFSPMVYLHCEAEEDGVLDLTEEHTEQALHVIDGAVSIEGETYDSGAMVVLQDNARPDVQVKAGTRLMVLGGAPLDGDRHMWWNFVSSFKDRIERAKEDWTNGRFADVPGESEFIPLPD